jgi:hypothetical protein
VNAIITVQSEELLELSRGVIEGSLVERSSEALPALANRNMNAKSTAERQLLSTSLCTR